MPADISVVHIGRNLTEVERSRQLELRRRTTDLFQLGVIISPMSFAERLKEARRAAGFTQQQLADACELTNAAISKMEAGLTDAVLAPNLFAMAKFLHVDPQWLATGEPSNGSILGHDFATLPEDQQAAVRALILSLKK